MTKDLSYVFFTSAIIFCRVGIVLMILPGFGSARIPSVFRLFVALSISFCISNTEYFHNQKYVINASVLVLNELLLGISFGLFVRSIFLALEVICELISHCIGLANNFGAPIDGYEPTLAITSIVQLTSLSIFFALNIHHEIIISLIRVQTHNQ